jgi:predicted transcriptional regulator
MIEPKEIKQEIRKLKKLKLQCRPGSKERIDLHRQIKDLKNKLIGINILEPGKEKLIAEILILEPNFPKDLVNLNKYTIEQLKIHIDKVKSRKRT